MLYTTMTKKAMRLCFEAHKEQTDKSGLPYVFHPFHVAEQMTDEITTVVALLHDVVEDTDYTLQDLRDMGFPQEAVDAIAMMTHDDAVPYLTYVAGLKTNPIARAVKLADLRHNSDLTRLDSVSDWDRERAEKYRKAIALLEDGEEAAQMTRGTADIEEKAGFLRVSYEDFGALDYEATYTLDAGSAEKLRRALEAEGLRGALRDMIVARFGACLEKEPFSLYCDEREIRYELSTWIG
ncbi:MAG: hypothetical protein IJ594_08820 [Oscillospiraceae bacterium]|nr:hypothetical protein [Oscillospiraceae bacterium]